VPKMGTTIFTATS